MVKWSVGDSVDYEVIGPRQKYLDDDGAPVLSTRRRHAFDGTATQVNGTWYPGYIARSDSKKLYFKYEASKFKSYEEPIDKASRDDLARLRAGTGSGPASAKKKKPAAKKSYERGVRGAKVHRWRRPVPDAGPRRSLPNRRRKRRPSRSPRPGNPRRSPRPRSLR